LGLLKEAQRFPNKRSLNGRVFTTFVRIVQPQRAMRGMDEKCSETYASDAIGRFASALISR